MSAAEPWLYRWQRRWCFAYEVDSRANPAPLQRPSKPLKLLPLQGLCRVSLTPLPARQWRSIFAHSRLAAARSEAESLVVLAGGAWLGAPLHQAAVQGVQVERLAWRWC